MGKKKKKNSETKPMPSLVFHEGTLEGPSNSIADLVEKEFQPKPKESSANTPQLSTMPGYNPSAKKLMWFAVVTVMLVICGLWAWSIQTQFSSIHLSATPEGDLLGKVKDSWNKSLYDDSGTPLTTDQLKTEVKKNLVRLFAANAATSTPSSTPQTSTTTVTTTIQTN
jgi:hypothetical protein